jgi:transposase-like protein
VDNTQEGATMLCSWHEERAGNSILDFKAEAVRLASLGHRSIQQIATDLDLTESSLRNWVNQADVGSGQRPSALDRALEVAV